MKKKGIIILTILVMLISSFPVYAATSGQTSPDGYWEYTIKDDGTIRIDKYLKETDRNITELSIPSQIDGKTVNELYNYIFSVGSSKSYVKKISVPNTIEKMGFGVFSSNSVIEEVVFESGSKITTLPDSTFNGTSNLKRVVLPDSLKYLKALSFQGIRNLESLEFAFPGTLEGIYNVAFLNTKIQHIKLPESAYFIVGDPFDGTNLSSLYYGPHTAKDGTYYLSYNMVQFGFNDDEYKPGDPGQWGKDPTMTGYAGGINEIYIDQIEGKYYWHTRDYIQNITHHFREPELTINKVSVNDAKNGYTVNATVSINKDEGFELNGMLNAVKYDSDNNRTVLDENEICTIDGRTNNASDAANGECTVNLDVNEFDYKVMLTHRGYEGTPDNGARNLIDKEWDQQIDGYKINYVSGDESKTIYYLNGEDNRYPTLEELGLKANDKFTGWKLSDGTTAKSGDAIADQTQGAELTLTAVTDGNQGSNTGGSGGNTGGGSGSGSVTTDRIGGDNRFETATKVADRLKSKLGINKFNTIIVACSDDFADALSAAPLASDKDAPILVVNKNNENYVKEYIDKNLSKSGRVYIIGETGVVSERFEKSLSGHNVTRLGGADRYETNLKVLDELNLTGKCDIMVASGLDYADALTASATGNPILLVKHNLFDEQLSYIRTLGNDDNYYVVGGTAAVNDTIFNQLKAVTGGDVSRVWGENRFQTGEAVANKFFKNARSIYIASGCDFPDALTGGVIANKNNAPLLLVNENNTLEAARFVDTHNVRKVTAIGGTAAVSEKVLRAVAG